MTFKPVEGGWGVSEGSFVAGESGPHKLLVEESRSGRRMESELLIRQPVLEKLGQPANGDALRQIAAITGGLNFETAELSRLIEKISVLPEPKPLEKRLRLWSHPAWSASILLLLILYWIGRKKAGLL